MAIRLCLVLLLVAAASCQWNPQQQQQQQQPQYIPQPPPAQTAGDSWYLPQPQASGFLDHDQMCDVVLDSSHRMLYYLFGMQYNPVDTSFLQCLHKSELEEFQRLMNALATLDMNMVALNVPGFDRVPRLPLLSCVGEEIFQQVNAEVAKRPEQDQEWPLPTWCGRYDVEQTVQQCAALIDQVIPTVKIPGLPQRTIPWTDVSFLKDMDDPELCYLRKASKEQLAGALQDKLLWDIIEIDPLERLLPAFRCYLQYLIENIDSEIEPSLSDGETSDSYCRDVSAVLASGDDEEDEEESDLQTRSLDSLLKRGMNRRKRLCLRKWRRGCPLRWKHGLPNRPAGKKPAAKVSNKVKVVVKVKVNIKNKIVNKG